jgi:hypothetical protein
MENHKPDCNLVTKKGMSCAVLHADGKCDWNSCSCDVKNKKQCCKKCRGKYIPGCNYPNNTDCPCHTSTDEKCYCGKAMNCELHKMCVTTGIHCYHDKDKEWSCQKPTDEIVGWGCSCTAPKVRTRSDGNDG